MHGPLFGKGQMQDGDNAKAGAHTIQRTTIKDCPKRKRPREASGRESGEYAQYAD